MFKRLVTIFLDNVSLFRRLSPLIFRLLILFERFIPIPISIILNRYFKSLNSEGKLSNYRVNVVRKGRLNYEIDLGIVLTKQQVNLLFDNFKNLLIRSIQNMVIEKNKDTDEELNTMAKGFLEEIRKATSKNLANTSFAKTVSQLSDVDYAESMLKIIKGYENPECEIEKREVVKGIIRTSWLQRIHSTIRSLLLGLVAAAILIPVLLIYGSLNMIQNVLLFFPIFVSGLVVTRILDRQLIKAAKKTVKYLSKHKRLRNFLMNYV